MTVTAIPALSEPMVALMSTAPSATDVIRPEDETIAIVVSDVAHVAVAPLISFLFWSCTVAVTREVSPSAENVTTVSDKTIFAAA